MIRYPTFCLFLLSPFCIRGHRSFLLLVSALLMIASVLMASAAHAHGYSAGSVRIDHPYALPSEVGADGQVYFRELRNRGRQPDRLLGAVTSRAERVELVNAQGQVVEAIEVLPGARLRLLHHQPVHLRLLGLTEPLRDGQRFDLILRFERGGERSVRVYVQQPRGD